MLEKLYPLAPFTHQPSSPVACMCACYWSYIRSMYLYVLTCAMKVPSDLSNRNRELVLIVVLSLWWCASSLVVHHQLCMSWFLKWSYRCCLSYDPVLQYGFHSWLDYLTSPYFWNSSRLCFVFTPLVLYLPNKHWPLASPPDITLHHLTLTKTFWIALN